MQPASDPAADADAVRRIDGLQNRVFLDPTLRGEYPADVLADTASVTDWAFVHDGDLELIRQPLDALGLNYYSPTVVRAYAGSGPRPRPTATATAPPAPGRPARTSSSRPARAEDRHGLERRPERPDRPAAALTREYPGADLYVTENGAAYADKLTDDGAVHDDDRIAYLHGHLRAVAAPSPRARSARLLPVVPAGQLRVVLRLREALRAGARRLRDPGAHRKHSAHWYAEVVRRNGLPAA